MITLFALASFVGAGLLFLVQPMVAKMVLPLYGGSPAVWNTAVLFFQGVLLAGYLYTHTSTRRLGMRRQPPVHLLLLAIPLVVLPISLPSWAAPTDGTPPALSLLAVLAVTVGLPFLLVSTTGPLLQRWFSATDHARAADPYFLYAAGNAGSVIALVAYPLVVEPSLTLRQQSRLWSVAYVLFVILVVACARQVRRHPAADVAAPPAINEKESGPLAGGIGWRRRGSWIALAFLPSSLMLGVTTYMSTDIAAVPLLWVLPLSLYLLTFIVAFGRSRPPRSPVPTRLLGGLVVVLAVIMASLVRAPTSVGIVAHLLVFTAVAFVSHRRLAGDRPTTTHLTEFYLLISIGGVLGGVFNGLLAPVIFDRLLEYPLIVAASLLVTLQGGPAGFLTRRYGKLGSVLEAALFGAAVLAIASVFEQKGLDGGAPVTVACLGAAVVIGWLAAQRPRAVALVVVGALMGVMIRSAPSLFTDRTFFGVYRVYESGDRHVLRHGVTVHGWQRVTAGRRNEPQSYYSRPGPAGSVFAVYGPTPLADNVGLVGLGTGALAAYGRAGQTMRFYEIDQAVVDIARNRRYFTYLADSRAEVDIVVGDARLEISEAPDHGFGLIVLDAFSSDSIPVHLMTDEAVRLYRSKLRADGLLLFHISNRYLDLQPVLAGIARRQGLSGLVWLDEVTDAETGREPSEWLVLTAEPQTLEPLRGDRRWRPIDGSRSVRWTDDFSNVVSVLRWE